VGLTLAYLRKLPDLIDEFGEAAQKRADGSADAAGEIKALRDASSWQGSAREAADDALNRKVTALDASQERDAAVVAAARGAHDRAQQTVAELNELQDFAEKWPVCRIDEATNTVTPPNTNFLHDDAAKAAEAKFADVQNRVAQILAEGEEADFEFGNAIKTGTGGGAPEDGPLPQGSGGTPIHNYTDKDLYPHDPTAADIHQDQIGDCYFDATAGAIANANPQWIKDRIHYDDKTGTFDVTLWDGHQWKHLPVTQDDIQTDIAQHGASWLDNGQPKAALWPSVLESAYAKMKYPDRNLEDALGKTGIGKGGYAQDAMEALTGNRGTNINPQNVWFTNQHIDQDITTALANHQPVTISTTPHGTPLAQSHVYVVEGITGTGSDAQVTLRNPWETNIGTPINTPGPLVTVRLGDLIGSGPPDPFGGTHPMSDVTIGSLG
jgi:hypothetical protein